MASIIAKLNLKKFLQDTSAPLRVRNIRLLLGGQMASSIGDQFYIVALPWLIFSNGGSAQDLGLLLTTYGVSRLLSVLAGGPLSDRFRPRIIMLVSDSIRMCLVGIMALLARVGHPAFWSLAVLSVLLGTSTGLFLPSSFAILPELLPKQDLQPGNALNSSTTQIANLLGPGLGGLIISLWQVWAAFLLDTISFALSIITLFMIKDRSLHNSNNPVYREYKVDEEHQALETVPSSISFPKFLLSSHLLQAILLVAVFGNLTTGGLLEVALPFLARTFTTNSGGYGLLLVAFAVGALLGALCSGGLSNIPYRGVIALCLGFAMACAFALLPWTGGLTGAFVDLAIAGAANGMSNTFFITLLQQRIPTHLLGSAMGILMFSFFGLYPISVLLTGIFIIHWGIFIFFPICAALIIVSVIFGLLQSEIRHV